MIHTEPRYTKDLDIWVDRSAANAAALVHALSNFGAPLKGITSSDFTQAEVFYQIGIDPVRVDILTTLPGLEFSDAWERLIVDFDGEPAPVISREDLVRSKAITDRPSDPKHAR